jgi:hypothetical protein
MEPLPSGTSEMIEQLMRSHAFDQGDPKLQLTFEALRCSHRNHVLAEAIICATQEQIETNKKMVEVTEQATQALIAAKQLPADIRTLVGANAGKFAETVLGKIVANGPIGGLKTSVGNLSQRLDALDSSDLNRFYAQLGLTFCGFVVLAILIVGR